MVALRYAKGVFDLVKWFLVAAFVIVIFNYYFVSIFFVSGPSMEPNLHDRAAVLVNRLIYRIHQPSRGDLVVVQYPGDPNQTSYVKRVVGLPGETVSISGGRVLIDGQTLTESYLEPGLITEPDSLFVIPVDQYFTLGDNRPLSSDSRYYGSVESRFLLGRVELTVWPFTLYPEVIY